MSIPSVESVSRDLNLSSNIHINKKNLKFINQIKFSNVSYKYPNSDSKILKDINLTIKKNDIICVQGDSGSGKTTFVDLLTGLIKPTTGKIKTTISSWILAEKNTKTALNDKNIEAITSAMNLKIKSITQFDKLCKEIEK